MAKMTQKSIEIIRKNDRTLYFKTPIRFPVEIEDDIRAAADASGKTLNSFVVSAVCQAAGIPEPQHKTAGRKPKAKTAPKNPDDLDV